MLDGENLEKSSRCLYIKEIDLNQGPLDPAHASNAEFDSLSEELTSVHEHVQDRIRRLVEVVPSRDRQHQNWPPVDSTIQIRNSTGDTAAVTGAQVEGMEHQRVEEGIDESGKRRMMKGVKLIAKALEDVERCTRRKAGGRANFFDCNVCLSIAKDPVLTCCGHMFCWPCFYHLPYAYGNAKECPVCDGEVIETNITPIYGNSSGSDDSDVACSTVPPRPVAPRINSFRYYF